MVSWGVGAGQRGQPVGLTQVNLRWPWKDRGQCGRGTVKRGNKRDQESGGSRTRPG